MKVDAARKTLYSGPVANNIKQHFIGTSQRLRSTLVVVMRGGV